MTKWEKASIKKSETVWLVQKMTLLYRNTAFKTRKTQQFIFNDIQNLRWSPHIPITISCPALDGSCLFTDLQSHHWHYALRMLISSFPLHKRGEKGQGQRRIHEIQD